MTQPFSHSILLRPRLIELRRRWFCNLVLSSCVFGLANYAVAQEAGTAANQDGKAQELVLPKSFDGEDDLEEATRLRLNIDSIDTLKEIIALTESALKKGLDEADAESAKKMIAATYVQKTQESIGELNGGKRMSQARLNKLLNDFLEDLGQAIEYDPLQVDAFLMKTELLARRNEREEAKRVADEGVANLTKHLESNREEAEYKGKVSKLLMMRAGLQSEPEDVIEDLKKSVTIFPNNPASVILLYKSMVENEKLEEAIEFFQSTLVSSPDNEMLIRSTAELLASDPKRMDESITLLDGKIKLLPLSVELLKTRARVHRMRALGETLDADAKKAALDLAQADLDKAVEMAKEDVETLLTRAQLFLQSDKIDEAKKDVDAAIELDPGRVAAIEMRSIIASEQKRFGDAINDLELIIKNEPKDAPKNLGLLLKLGFLYSQDSRPKQSIKVFDQIIKIKPDFWEGYRFRGDVRLTVGQYSEALVDFEKALELIPDDEKDRSGILNNLSWVLSTSPDDSIRNGKRALELGLKACELTNYEKQHILSTLAAAYAEVGEFEKAIEWSEKAVKIAKEKEDVQLEQYESELETYKSGKCWREKVDVKENPRPLPGDDGVET